MSAKKSDIGQAQKRITLRVPESVYVQLHYWAEQADCSVNEFFMLMLDQWIDIQNGNYELPTLEASRVNQLVDGSLALQQEVRALTAIVTDGFESLLSLTRGDNYLNDIDPDVLTEEE